MLGQLSPDGAGPSWGAAVRGEPADHAPVNPGHTKAEMGYLRSVYHQNRSVGGRHASAMHLARTVPGCDGHEGHAYEGDYQLVKEPLLVAIDFTDIKLA